MHKKAFRPRGVKGQTTKDVKGGPEGIRTPDLLHAMQTRSQLRHRPRRQLTASLIIVPYTSAPRKSITRFVASPRSSSR